MKYHKLSLKLIALFFLVSCSSPEVNDHSMDKFNEAIARIDSSNKARLYHPNLNDGYSNPIIDLDGNEYSSNQLQISDINTGEALEVINKENKFYFGHTRDEAKELVLALNYNTNPITYFVDSIKDKKSKGLVSATIFHVHRRLLNIVGSGYTLEKYVVLEQYKKNGDIIMIQIAKVDSNKMYSYQSKLELQDLLEN